MNKRRELFRRIGFLGAAATAPSAAIAMSTFAPKESIEHLQPGSASITLTGKPIDPNLPRGDVSLSVGKDKRLWIQVEGKWKRVVTEG